MPHHQNFVFSCRRSTGSNLDGCVRPDVKHGRLVSAITITGTNQCQRVDEAGIHLCRSQWPRNLPPIGGSSEGSRLTIKIRLACGQLPYRSFGLAIPFGELRDTIRICDSRPLLLFTPSPLYDRISPTLPHKRARLRSCHRRSNACGRPGFA